MISIDFAPNEKFSDALTALKTLVKPWTWKKGNNLVKVKRKIKSCFPDSNIFLFLSGRTALYQLIKSLELPNNSEILVQGFTCEAVILPILANNFKPVYVDIEAKTLSMDSKELEKKLTKNSKVIILQHTFGLIPQYRKQIFQFAKKHNLFIVEDLAHGFSNPTSLSASLGTGNSAFLLSFGRSKIVSSLFGGAIVTKNDILNRKLQLVDKNLSYPSNLFIFKALIYKPLVVFIKATYNFYLGRIIHKIANGLNLLIPEISKKEKKGEFDILLNKSYPNALAGLLLNQLNKFEHFQNIRAKSSRIYEETLKDKGIGYHFLLNNFSLLRYPLLIENRDEVIAKARRKHIYLGRWYDQVVAPKSINLERFQYKVGECQEAEKICEKIINLPTLIKEKQVKKVIESL